MTDPRAKQFDDMHPPVTEADIVAAAKAGRVVMSWGALPAVGADSHITGLTIKFALGDGSFPAMIFDRYSAAVLLLMLQELEKADWQATQTTPPGQKPN